MLLERPKAFSYLGSTVELDPLASAKFSALPKAWTSDSNLMYQLLFKEKVWKSKYRWFTRYFVTDGYRLKALYLNENTRKRKKVYNGFHSTNYYSLFKDHTRQHWEILTGFRTKGGGRNEIVLNEDAHKGLMNLDFAAENFFKGGKKALKQFPKNHIIISFDPGSVHEVSGVAIKTTFNDDGTMTLYYIPLNFSTKAKYAAYKVTMEFTANALKEIQNLGTTSAKSSSLDQVQKHWDNLESCTHLPKENASHEHLEVKFANDRARQRFYSSMINKILAACDQLVDGEDGTPTRIPIILFGNNYGSQGTGGKGHECSAPI
jgi:hypothetical protein